MSFSRRAVVILVSLALTVGFALQARSEVPEQINFQGQLTNNLGTPLDGDYLLFFSIYDVPVDGTALWVEYQTVKVDAGIYNVQIGQDPTGNPFSTNLFDGQRWLGVTVGTDAEMMPRQLLTSTPFAMRSAVADRVENGAIGTIHLADNAVTSEKVADGAIISAKIADGAIISAKIADGTVTAADISDGSGSGLDADTVDDLHASSFSSASHNHDTLYVNTTGDAMSGMSNLGPILNVINTGAGSGVSGYALDNGDVTNYGVYGSAKGKTGHGVHGDSNGYDGHGVHGYSNGYDGYGVYGEAPGASGEGVRGYASGNYGRAVVGVADYTGGTTTHGGHFTANSSNGRGVYGESTGATGTGIYGMATDTGDVRNYGGYFKALGEQGVGVYGEATHTGSDYNVGGSFKSDGTTGHGVNGVATGRSGKGVAGYSSGTNGNAVYGYANQTADVTNYGGFFQAEGETGRGVYGVASNIRDVQNFGGQFVARGTSGIGVYGEANGASAYAGYFNGRGYFSGYLTKAGGGFKIDHPLKPESKYLNHSFVESPDMMNIYNGNVLLNTNGEAWVVLPEWFETLNRDFRYQLTCIGGFAQVYIAEEIADNGFKIAGGKPGMKISWQVTGVRQDVWANANRLPVEENKTDKELGHYMHPKLHGQPEEKSVEWARDPKGMQRMKEEREKANAATGQAKG